MSKRLRGFLHDVVALTVGAAVFGALDAGLQLLVHGHVKW